MIRTDFSKEVTFKLRTKKKSWIWEVRGKSIQAEGRVYAKHRYIQQVFVVLKTKMSVTRVEIKTEYL